ncbi:MAG: RNA 2',3'-cyclic phosphodiesterase [Planctomycetota bacterium]
MGRTGTWRLFVAAYPDASCAAALAGIVDRVCDLPAHRATPAHQIHLTLHFIGEVTARDTDDTIDTVRHAVHGITAFDLVPEKLIVLPRRGRSRVLAVETSAPSELLEVHRRLVARLAMAPRRRSGDRFVPHLTICRFAPPTDATCALPDVDVPPFSIQEIHVMRSVLHPDGAAHRSIACIPLV